MQVIDNCEELFDFAQESRAQGLKIGFVPTMGALHRGHLSLVLAAKQKCDLVVVSVFVNPLQFNNPLDFERYPRDLAHDLSLLENSGVALVFSPSEDEMHPKPIQIGFRVEGISGGLEGKFRPGHFDGVANVVGKLFNCIGPAKAFFGEKDYQQVKVINRLVREFHFPIEIFVVPTLREVDGLAMSSRNLLLTPRARKAAAGIYAAFSFGRGLAIQNEPSDEVLESMTNILIDRAGGEGAQCKVDYVAHVRGESLEEISLFEDGSRFFIAASYDGVRLIDNIGVFDK